MSGGWFDSEAIETERFEADMEMADLEAHARANRKVCSWRAGGVLAGCGKQIVRGELYDVYRKSGRTAHVACLLAAGRPVASR